MSAPQDPPSVSTPEGEDRPPCYGDADTVCPRDEDGVMQPRAACLSCSVLKTCLQKALRAQGLIRDPILESPVVSKASRFLKRWSDRKLMHKNSGKA